MGYGASTLISAYLIQLTRTRKFSVTLLKNHEVCWLCSQDNSSVRTGRSAHSSWTAPGHQSSGWVTSVYNEFKALDDDPLLRAAPKAVCLDQLSHVRPKTERLPRVHFDRRACTRHVCRGPTTLAHLAEALRSLLEVRVLYIIYSLMPETDTSAWSQRQDPSHPLYSLRGSAGACRRA